MENVESEQLEIICIFYKIAPKISEAFSSNIIIRLVNTPAEFEAMLNSEIEDPNASRVCAILYSPQDKSYAPMEVAQSLSFKYSGTPIIYITTEIDKTKDREQMKKNGFNDLFIEPFEIDLIQKKLLTILSKFKSTNIKLYAPIKMVDIQVGDVFDFDIFLKLAVSQKYIKYIRAGVAITSETLDKLRKHDLTFLYIPEESLSTFFKMAGSKLSLLNGSPMLTSTEKQHKVESLLRSVTYKFFDPKKTKVSAISEAKELFKELNSIVENFILKSEKASWFKKMKMTIGGKQDPYSHSTRVGSLGSLFSIAINEGRPELISIAALIHDLGKTMLPSELADKTEEQLSGEDLKKYQMHPELSIRILKERRLMIDDTLTECILLHHKKWNGSGYPLKIMSGDKIPIEAQLLSIADEMDYLISSDNGEPQVTPAQAFDILDKKLEHNPMLIRRLKAIFCQQLD